MGQAMDWHLRNTAFDTVTSLGAAVTKRNGLGAHHRVHCARRGGPSAAGGGGDVSRTRLIAQSSWIVISKLVHPLFVTFQADSTASPLERGPEVTRGSPRPAGRPVRITARP